MDGARFQPQDLNLEVMLREQTAHILCVFVSVGVKATPADLNSFLRKNVTELCFSSQIGGYEIQ